MVLSLLLTKRCWHTALPADGSGCVCGHRAEGTGLGEPWRKARRGRARPPALWLEGAGRPQHPRRPTEWAVTGPPPTHGPPPASRGHGRRGPRAGPCLRAPAARAWAAFLTGRKGANSVFKETFKVFGVTFSRPRRGTPRIPGARWARRKVWTFPSHPAGQPGPGVTLPRRPSLSAEVAPRPATVGRPPLPGRSLYLRKNSET